MPPGPGFAASSSSQSRVMIDAWAPRMKQTPPLRSGNPFGMPATWWTGFARFVQSLLKPMDLFPKLSKTANNSFACDRLRLTSLSMVHRAVADGEFATASELIGVDLSTYDSVQFAHMHGGTWPADVLTEIVSLKLK